MTTPPVGPVTRLQTDPARTAQRLAALDAYYSRAVLDDGRFVCRHADACGGSADKPGVGFYEAQGSSLGPHYDVSEDGVPTRVLIVAMETGRKRSRVTIEQRTAEVRDVVNRPWSQWNPHMRGVGLALRLAFGHDLGADEAGLHLRTPDGPVHVIDAYAMANLLLCSAVQLDTVNSRSTPTMRRNCAPHLAATIDILEPNLVITQGATVSQPFASLVEVLEERGPNLAVCGREGRRFAWVDLHHPTYTWSRLTDPYLLETATPALIRGRRLARAVVSAERMTPDLGPGTTAVAVEARQPPRPALRHTASVQRSGWSRRQIRDTSIASVVDQLTRRGLAARRTDGSDRSVDVLVDRAEGRQVRIKVKAKLGGASWQASTTQGSAAEQPSGPADEFWVLVDLRPAEPIHYVVPAWWFANDIHRVHSAYLASHGGQRPVTRESTHHAIADSRVLQWRDRWDLLA